MLTLGLGFVKDPVLDRYISRWVPIKMLNGQACRFVVEGYDSDDHQDGFRTAIVNLVAADETVLQQAEPYLYQYYQDSNPMWEPGDDEYVAIDRPAGVWKHIEPGKDLVVARRPYGDQGVYVSLECECDWEPEHGLQIVFKNGRYVSKVGPYDGHYSHADAYDDESLEDVVYWSPSQINRTEA
jgi:hypothetical protein